jgi:fructosamine-3-kinase
VLGPQELADAYGQMGRAVAQIHAINFPFFGEFYNDGSIQDGEPFLSALEARSHLFVRSERLRDLFLSVLDQNEQLFRDVPTPSLCHEDLHAYNILFERQSGGWRLATILDFDKAWAGHNEIDLARLDFWRGMVSPDFWLAYKATHAIDDLYLQRRPIYQLLWCLEFAKPISQHLADTRRVCTELGLPPIDRFD